jgi:hypothetical protein
MFTYPFLLIGIGLMIWAVIIGKRLLQIIENKQQKKFWYILFILICFFLLGYISYLLILFFVIHVLDMSTLLTSSIFCFGAVFVVMVLKITTQLILTMNKTAKNMEENNETLRKNSMELENTKKLLETKNNELLQTLEDFYTIRISMQKQMEDGKYETENSRIKERIEKLKET